MYEEVLGNRCWKPGQAWCHWKLGSKAFRLLCVVHAQADRRDNLQDHVSIIDPTVNEVCVFLAAYLMDSNSVFPCVDNESL